MLCERCEQRTVKYYYFTEEAALRGKSLDFGIAQLHFQLGAAHKGVQGKWNKKGEFVTDDKVIKFPTQSEGETENE